MADNGIVTSPLERVARVGWMWLIGLGIASVVIGLIVLVWPDQTLRVVGVLFGIYLLVMGAMEIVIGFSPGRTGWFRFLSIVAGALAIMLGVISFRGALESILLLALWIGFGWLFTGITRLVAAASEPQLPYRGWHIFGGIVLTMGGFVIIIWPLHSVFALALLAGIWLIVIGIWEIIEAFMVHRRVGELAPS